MSNPRRTPMARSGAGAAVALQGPSLAKGATFHLPQSSDSAPFVPPSLPRRSHTNLDDVIDAQRRRIMMTLTHIDETLASAGESASVPRKPLRDDCSPIPKGLLDTTPTMARYSEGEGRVLRPRQNRRPARFHESDSGLGTSLAGSSEKRALEDGKATAAAAAAASAAPARTSAITRSALASATPKESAGLSPRATSRIFEYTLKPLLAKPAYKDFHPLLLQTPKKIQDKQIICLRDLEKTLLLTAPERTKIASLYLDFCLTSIACIQATVEYLGDREQTRPHDLPYSNGYFIDLVDQIQNYARQLADADNSSAKSADKNIMDIDSADEIKLHGGIAINGRPAELVRVKKDGTAFSLATGQQIENLEEGSKGGMRFKRSASQELEDEEEIMRSMARRKKNAPPEEYAPKQCREPGCNKEFKRPCDLTKHEKTHSRPWKCPVPTCKYHEYGWPTEKEMDRHHNDKHSQAPPMYECMFKPCPYKSKRDSNCKQHMEKAHGWTYVRTKTNGKLVGTSSVKQDSVAQVTPQLTDMPTPDSDKSINVSTPPEGQSIFHNNLDFPSYDPFQPSLDFPQELHMDWSPPENNSPSSSSGIGNNSAYEDIGQDFTLNDDIYSASARLPPSMLPHQQMFGAKGLDQQYAAFAPAEAHMPPAPNFSPVGQVNAMLYTPKSLGEVDEGFDNFNNILEQGDDFLLFPPTDFAKQPQLDCDPPFTYEAPSAAAGYSQPSSQTFLQMPMDWNPPSSQGFPMFNQFTQQS